MPETLKRCSTVALLSSVELAFWNALAIIILERLNTHCFGRKIIVHFFIHRTTYCSLFPGVHETVKIIFIFLCNSSCCWFSITINCVMTLLFYLLDIS